MAEILTCRLKFDLVGAVFHSEEFHTVEAARAAGAEVRRHIPADLFIVDAAGQTVEVLP